MATLPRQLVVMGQDVTSYVVDWGNVDDIKDVLLAQTSLMSGQYQVTLGQAPYAFSPYNQGSLFYGRAAKGQTLTLSLAGVQSYLGIIQAVEMDGVNKTCLITVENLFNKAAAQTAVLSATNINPASAMLSLLVNAGLGPYTNQQSFYAAAAPAAAAGATVSVNWTASGGTTILAALQALEQLASISVYISNGIISARAYSPYQGASAGLKGTLGNNLARSWNGHTQAYDNFANQVTITYGANLVSTQTNLLGVSNNGNVVVPLTFSYANGGALVVPNFVSAVYFGANILQRASGRLSKPRDVVEVDVGVELQSAQLGDRWSVTSYAYGMTGVASEIIEIHRKPEINGATLKLATI